MMNSWQLKRLDFVQGCGVQKGNPSAFWFVVESAHSQPTFERRVLKVQNRVSGGLVRQKTNIPFALVCPSRLPPQSKVLRFLDQLLGFSKFPRLIFFQFPDVFFRQ